MEYLNILVEEDNGVEDNVGPVSPKKNKESFQLPAMNHRKCLEAHYSGTTSLPLLTNHTPVACSVVKHKDNATIDCETESITTLDPRTNVPTPSDVPSMTIVPYSSPSPNSWCSLTSVDSSPTHSRSGNVTPSVRSGDTNTNPESCDASPTHNHSQNEHSKFIRKLSNNITI